ncbi:MAG TPA: GNAT family N-acetyltransferase [Allosphingosinicella sp.]|jgi:RimJ/RimL family protein N-acetyltransferase
MRFELQPVLEGERLTLRPLREADFEALYAAAADPEIWRQHPASDRWQAPVFRDYFDGALASGGAFAVVDRADGRVIGSTRFHEYRPERGEIEIGYTFLARSHWGGAWNAEMKRLMLGHAFRFVESVVFVVGPDNLRSQRAVEKIGGVREGPVERRGRRDILFRIRRADWEGHV